MVVMPDSHLTEHEAYTCTVPDLSASIDWAVPAFPGYIKALGDRNKLPFILDTGATTHISSCSDDFSTLTTIPHHSIWGVGGSSVTATGIGDVTIQLDDLTTLVLRCVLYVPSAKIRLISIGILCADGNYTATFDSQTCQILAKDGCYSRNML
jgi:hypothetical protein